MTKTEHAMEAARADFMLRAARERGDKVAERRYRDEREQHLKQFEALRA